MFGHQTECLMVFGRQTFIVCPGPNRRALTRAHALVSIRTIVEEEECLQ